ncbi:MAG: hypothetical protein J6S67_13285 [Methanobrevibacter sp.]|nr:hypothetical protein [Methanobrevibacter sp.]
MRRMYSEKELQTISKQIADEEIASNVIANPEDAGETELSGIQIGDDKYIIPQVIANPDPAGETALTGLQIGEDKYVIAVGGGKWYKHVIKYNVQNYTINVVSNVAESFTKQALINAFNGLSGVAFFLQEPSTISSSSDTYLRIQVLNQNMGTTYVCSCTFSNGSLSQSKTELITINSDTVTEL